MSVSLSFLQKVMGVSVSLPGKRVPFVELRQNGRVVARCCSDGELRKARKRWPNARVVVPEFADT